MLVRHHHVERTIVLLLFARRFLFPLFGFFLLLPREVRQVALALFALLAQRSEDRLQLVARL